MKKFLVIAFTMVVLAVSVLGVFNEPQKVEALGDFVDSNRGSTFYYKDGVGQITNWNQFKKGDSFYALITTNIDNDEDHTFGRRLVYADFGDNLATDIKYGNFDRAYSTRSNMLSRAIWRFECVGDHDSTQKKFVIHNGADDTLVLDGNERDNKEKRVYLHKNDDSNNKWRQWLLPSVSGAHNNAAQFICIGQGGAMRPTDTGSYDNATLYCVDPNNTNHGISRKTFYIFPLIQNYDSTATYGFIGNEFTTTISLMEKGSNLVSQTHQISTSSEKEILVRQPGNYEAAASHWTFKIPTKQNVNEHRSMCTWRIEDAKGNPITLRWTNSNSGARLRTFYKTDHDLDSSNYDERYNAATQLHFVLYNMQGNGSVFLSCVSYSGTDTRYHFKFRFWDVNNGNATEEYLQIWDANRNSTQQFYINNKPYSVTVTDKISDSYREGNKILGTPSAGKTFYPNIKYDLPTTYTGYTLESGTSYIIAGRKDGTSTSTYATSINITRTFAPNVYTLTYNAVGGIVNPTSKDVTYNSEYGTLATPTRTGHEFIGWYTAESGGTEVTSETIVTNTSNHTIYARWKSLPYTVSNPIFKDTEGNNLTDFSKLQAGKSMYCVMGYIPGDGLFRYMKKAESDNYIVAQGFNTSEDISRYIWKVTRQNNGYFTFENMATPGKYINSWGAAPSNAATVVTLHDDAHQWRIEESDKSGYYYVHAQANQNGTAFNNTGAVLNVDGGSSEHRVITYGRTDGALNNMWVILPLMQGGDSSAYGYTTNFSSPIKRPATGNGLDHNLSETPTGYGNRFVTQNNSDLETLFVFESSEAVNTLWTIKNHYNGSVYSMDFNSDNKVGFTTSSDKKYLIGYTTEGSGAGGYYIITLQTGEFIKVVDVPGGSESTCLTLYGIGIPSANQIFDFANTYYTLTHNVNGGTFADDSTADKTIEYDYSTTGITLQSAPSRIGYTFDGWELSAKDGVWGSSLLSADSAHSGKYGDITLTAKWTINKYSVAFDSNGGGDLSTITQDYDTSVDLSSVAPERDGYTFCGWSLSPSTQNPTFATSHTLGAENVTYYAYYIKADASSVKDTLLLNENKLTASAGLYTFELVESLPPTYKWERIGGGSTHSENGSTYTVTDADKDHAIKCTVTVTVNGVTATETAVSALYVGDTLVDADVIPGATDEHYANKKEYFNDYSISEGKTIAADTTEEFIFNNDTSFVASKIIFGNAFNGAKYDYSVYGILGTDEVLLFTNVTGRDGVFATSKDANVSNRGISFNSYKIKVTNNGESDITVSTTDISLLELPRVYELVKNGSFNTSYETGTDQYSTYAYRTTADGKLYFYAGDKIKIDVPVAAGSKLTAGSHITVNGKKVFPTHSVSTNGFITFIYTNQYEYIVKRYDDITLTSIGIDELNPQDIEIGAFFGSVTNDKLHDLNFGPLGVKLHSAGKIRFGTVWYFDDNATNNSWSRGDGMGTYVIPLINIFKTSDTKTNDFIAYLEATFPKSGAEDIIYYESLGIDSKLSYQEIINKWNSCITEKIVSEEGIAFILPYLKDFINTWNSERQDSSTAGLSAEKKAEKIKQMSFGGAEAKSEAEMYYYRTDENGNRFMEYSVVMGISESFKTRQLIFIPYASYVADWDKGFLAPNNSSYPDNIYLYKAPEKVYTYNEVAQNQPNDGVDGGGAEVEPSEGGEGEAIPEPAV